MAITTFARIQHRRGIKSDLPPSLFEGELGWCVDTRELFIGNGSPFEGNTQVLTANSPNNDLITNFWRTKDSAITASRPRPLGAKLNDFSSVKDFGAVGDGVADDALAINTAIAELFSYVNTLSIIDQIKHVTIYLPAGVYYVSESLLLYPFVNLVGDGPGNTIIKCSSTANYPVLQTADSQGNTGANIGVGGAAFPTNISVKNLTISTNTSIVDCVQLYRYNNVVFENVEFIGGYSPGDSGLFPHAGILMGTLGSIIPTQNLSLMRCQFRNVTYGLKTTQEISFTNVQNCVFDTLWRGIEFSTEPGSNGAAFTTVAACQFINTANFALSYTGVTYGLNSIGNSFKTCGSPEGVRAVFFGYLSTNCSSISDAFDTGIGVLDFGASTVIQNSTQTNITSLSSKNINFTKIGAPTSNETLYRDLIKIPVEFPANLANSSIFCQNPPTNNFTITFKINGVAFGTALIAAAEQSASFTAASATVFAPGDLLEVQAPAGADPTIGLIAVDLVATAL